MSVWTRRSLFSDVALSEIRLKEDQRITRINLQECMPVNEEILGQTLQRVTETIIRPTE
jgi:hypothetical protein